MNPVHGVHGFGGSVLSQTRKERGRGQEGSGISGYCGLSHARNHSECGSKRGLRSQVNVSSSALAASRKI
eukprot:358195-Rhodomonas_salina.4